MTTVLFVIAIAVYMVIQQKPSLQPIRIKKEDNKR
jgi:hypothetical protein